MTVSSSSVDLSIIIPHYNTPELLARTLASLQAQIAPPAFEVIVVDNGSDVVPHAICAAYPGVTLLREAEKGPGPARNRGARAARGAALLFIDADCVAAPDLLARAAARLDQHPGVGIICGDVSILPLNPARMSAIECYEELYAYRSELMVRRFGFAPTCNLAVRRAVFEAVGPFIPGLLISEDVEWGQRATSAGHVILFAPEMRIATPARETMAEVKRRWDRQVGQQRAEMEARAWGRLAWALKTAAMPVSPLAEIPNVLLSPRLPGPGARLRAFGCLVATRLWRTRRMVEVMLGTTDAEWLAGAWRRTA